VVNVGNGNSGRRPNLQRRRQVAELRAQGLSQAEIGRRLEVRREAVGAMLRKMGLAGDPVKPRYQVRCCACETLLWEDCPVGNNGAVFCLGCLARQPDVNFGQRLKAHRVTAKLTQGQLAVRTGLNRVVVSGYEHDRREPDWRSLTQLLAALGLRLLQVPPVQPLTPRRRRTTAGRSRAAVHRGRQAEPGRRGEG
jgi:transcriptional regulator with XRE-family HTH domain